MPLIITYLIFSQVSLNDYLLISTNLAGFARRLSCLVRFHANCLSLLGTVLHFLALFLVAVIRENGI